MRGNFSGILKRPAASRPSSSTSTRPRDPSETIACDRRRIPGAKITSRPGSGACWGAMASSCGPADPSDKDRKSLRRSLARLAPLVGRRRRGRLCLDLRRARRRIAGREGFRVHAAPRRGWRVGRGGEGEARNIWMGRSTAFLPASSAWSASASTTPATSPFTTPRIAGYPGCRKW